MANHTNWLNISAMSGSSGQTILTLTANTNYEDIDKVATIKAYNPVYNVSATTTVRISAYTPYIYINPSIIGVPASGGTYQFSISSNCSYVISYPDMVSSYSTTAGTGNTNITFSVSGTSADTTVVGNIVITDTSGQYSTTIRVEQYGEGVIITYSPSALTFPFSGGSATFTVSANCAYSIQKGSGTWYEISADSGYTGQTTFTVSSSTVNTGNTDWTDSITIVGPAGIVGTISVTEGNQGSARINYTADTSTIAASGEVRTITIDATDFINSSITVSVVGAPEGVTAVYTQSSTTRGVVTLTVPDNPGSPRDITVVVTGRRALSTTVASATIVFPQAEHTTYPIPYTADTSTVDASGETRTITIDTSNLVASSITIGAEGATGVTYTYQNGVITVVFPNNTGADRTINISINGKTIGGEDAYAGLTYTQYSHSIEDYLTFNIISGGNITWTAPNNFQKTIEYSKNNGSWVSITSTSQGTQISVDAGDQVRFRGDNQQYAMYDSIYYYSTFGSSTAVFEIEGNIMSLVDSTGFTTAVTISRDAFAKLFEGCTGLTSAGNLKLPATSLALRCYDHLFSGCENLTAAPTILPATTLADMCYHSTFLNCKRLVQAPILPATTLADACYAFMFQSCSALTEAPALPATTLAQNCYTYMFQACGGLTIAPELPAQSLVTQCYFGMFEHCTNLRYIKCLATNTSAWLCTGEWVKEVPNNGTFVTPSTTAWTTGEDGIPSGWTRVDAT